MKTLIMSQTKIMILGFVSSLTLSSSCNYQSDAVSEVVADEVSLASLSYFPTEDEIQSLVYMVEEEKMAMDVYTKMLELYGLVIFENISLSESRHVAAVCRLFEKYELDNPIEGNPPGVFVNEDIQSMYDNFILSGSSSVLGAKEVGISIEEKDITDIQTYLDEVVISKDIEQVYNNLLNGSQRHLSAFLTEIN